MNHYDLESQEHKITIKGQIIKKDISKYCLLWRIPEIYFEIIKKLKFIYVQPFFRSIQLKKVRENVFFMRFLKSR